MPSLYHGSQWHHDNDCYNVCIESTSKYRVPIFNLFEYEIFVVILSLIKAIKGINENTEDSK